MYLRKRKAKEGENVTDKLNISLIRKQRREKNISARYMSKMLGISESSYSRRESGDANFKAEELPTVSKVLDIPFEKIFIKMLLKSKE